MHISSPSNPLKIAKVTKIYNLSQAYQPILLSSILNMSQLSTSVWEPSNVLNIITPSNDIGCAGITQKGLACRWRLDGAIKASIRSLLFQMSEKPPRQTIRDLPELARLCLCEANHQDQVATVLETWTPRVEKYAGWLESRHIYKEETGVYPDPTIATPSNRTGKTSVPKVPISVDDILKEMEALSFRQKELQQALANQMAKPESQGTRTSSGQSTPSYVAVTPMGDSLSGLDESSSSSRRISKKGFWKR